MDKPMLLRLKNGSDVRGIALQEPGGPAVTLTEEAAGQIAASFAVWLGARMGRQNLRIGVGNDSRLTAEPLKKAITGGLCAQGAKVFDCELASTPAMFMGCVFEETGFDGSIMITASHLPKNRNGMKFFTREGGLDGGDITALLEGAAGIAHTAAGTAQPVPLMERYAAYLRDKIVEGAGLGASPLSWLHIVVDAGNGGGGFFVRSVLEPLGADCSGSQFLEPDGSFPNHQPNPENKEAMAAIRGAVLREKADLGIIFDTDVDRMSAVLSSGVPIDRNALIGMMAAILAPEYPGSTIVTDSITADRLTDFLEGTLGLRHHCYKRGYKNVISEAIRLNSEGIVTPLAIETSGHGALKENYFLDDGAYMAVRMLAAAAKAAKQGQKLDALLNGYHAECCEAEIRIPIAGEGFGEYGKTVLEAFRSRAQEKGITVVDSHEGVRLRYDGGWAMLRMSLHDPLLPLNLESAGEEGLKAIRQSLASLLDGFDRLDLSVFG